VYKEFSITHKKYMKNTTLITIVALIVLGAAGIYWSTAQTTQNVDSAEVSKEKTTAKLVAVTDQFDFGTIDIFAGKVSTAYTLKNEGEEAVTVTGAETSCMCTEGEIAGLTFGMHGSSVHSVVIEPGAEEVVTATFDPLAHGPNGTGKITRVLSLQTNSEATPGIELHFKADVTKE